MSQWYVLQTKVRHEVIAVQNLSNQSFETFLPMLCTRQSRKGILSPACEPLFPGYLFIKLDLERQNTAPIRSTRGVIRLVRLGATLQAFPEKLLNSLRQEQERGNGAIDPATVFVPGEDVQLISGPLAGMKAIFKARNSQERVVLLLNVLGNETQVSVSPNLIKKVS
ncbi:transcription/translation regulatory transformer protein RfaH [Granulosicoccus sp. 3-233]|uniref:transcription/translation regulatory transformer protein RfaH n=1 Tax=Granulosicoccus sp. 3-233 TaxID=3417969 RepID=UPI003D33B047